MLDTIKKVVYNSASKINNNPVLYILTSIIELIIVFYVIYKWNPFNIRKKYPEITQLFIIFIVFVQILNFMFIKEKINLLSTGVNINTTVFEFTIKILITLLSIFGSVILVYLLVNLLTTVDLFQHIFIWGVDALILISIISIVYLLIRPIINQGKDIDKKGVLALIGSILLYIPCIFINFIDWTKNQIEITTKTTWIILLLLVILLGVKTLLPIIANKVISGKGNTLLNKPVFLNTKTSIGSFKTLHSKSHNRNYEYAISFWYWVDSLPPNTRKSYTKYVNILEFGNKPAIQYNSLENTLRILCDIHDDKQIILYETNNNKLQRWNNIVINYDKGTMDIFINGELVSSKQNVVPFMTNELITVGEDNGIEGRITNVIYFKEILSSQKIKMAYNTLKNRNHPNI